MKKRRVLRNPLLPYTVPQLQMGKSWLSQVTGLWAQGLGGRTTPYFSLSSYSHNKEHALIPLYLDPHEQTRAGVICGGQCRAGQQLEVPFEIIPRKKPQSQPPETIQVSAGGHCKGFKCVGFC